MAPAYHEEFPVTQNDAVDVEGPRHDGVDHALVGGKVRKDAWPIMVEKATVTSMV